MIEKASGMKASLLIKTQNPNFRNPFMNSIDMIIRPINITREYGKLYRLLKGANTSGLVVNYSPKKIQEARGKV